MANGKYTNDVKRAYDRVRIVLESLEDAPDVDAEYLAAAQWQLGVSLGLVSVAIREAELDKWIGEM